MASETLVEHHARQHRVVCPSCRSREGMFVDRDPWTGELVATHEDDKNCGYTLVLPLNFFTSGHRKQ